MENKNLTFIFVDEYVLLFFEMNKWKCIRAWSEFAVEFHSIEPL